MPDIVCTGIMHYVLENAQRPLIRHHGVPI